jgi:hypothetical protein
VNNFEYVSPFALEQKAKCEMERKARKEEQIQRKEEKKQIRVDGLKKKQTMYTELFKRYVQGDGLDRLMTNQAVRSNKLLMKLAKECHERSINTVEFITKLLGEQKKKSDLAKKEKIVNGINVNGVNGKQRKKKNKPVIDYSLLSNRLKVLNQKELLEIFVNQLGFGSSIHNIDLTKLKAEQIALIEEYLVKFEKEKMERLINGLPEEHKDETATNNIMVNNCHMHPFKNILDSDISESLDDSSSVDDISSKLIVI